MTRQSSRKKSIKKWNWLVDETLDMENEADLSSGDDSMTDPDFTLVATNGVSEGVGIYDNNNSVKHNVTEVFRTSETNIENSGSKSSSMDLQQDQFESSMTDKTLECPPQVEKAMPEKSTELESVKVDQIRSLSNLDLISPPSASKSRVVSLQSIFSNVSEIRDFDTENNDEGVVPVTAYADESRHCAQTKIHVKNNGGGRAGVYPDVNGQSSIEALQEIRDDQNVSDVNARNDNGLTTTRKQTIRKPSDSACTSLGSNKIGMYHIEKPIVSNMKNLASVSCPPETARGKEKWELNVSNRTVSMEKGPRKSKSMTPRVPNSPCPRFANQSSLPAPRIAKVMPGGLLRRHKAVASSAIISSSTFPKNTVNRMQHPNLRSLAEHGTLTVSKRSEDYKPNSLDLTIPSGISVTRVKENKLSLGDLALALRDLSDNRGQTRNVQLEVTDAQARGLKTLGLIEDSIIIL